MRQDPITEISLRLGRHERPAAMMDFLNSVIGAICTLEEAPAGQVIIKRTKDRLLLKGDFAIDSLTTE